jgi:hypothetical protein
MKKQVIKNKWAVYRKKAVEKSLYEKRYREFVLATDREPLLIKIENVPKLINVINNTNIRRSRAVELMLYMYGYEFISIDRMLSLFNLLDIPTNRSNMRNSISNLTKLGWAYKVIDHFDIDKEEYRQRFGEQSIGTQYKKRYGLTPLGIMKLKQFVDEANGVSFSKD